MALTRLLNIRLEPEEQDALVQAANEDRRPVSSMGRLILVQWLRERGRLAPQTPAAPAPSP